MLLIVFEIYVSCYLRDSLFGFECGKDQDYAHYLAANLLLNVNENNYFLYFAGLDMDWAFYSEVHAHILLMAHKHGLYAIFIQCDMNKMLNVKVKFACFVSYDWI